MRKTTLGSPQELIILLRFPSDLTDKSSSADCLIEGNYTKYLSYRLLYRLLFYILVYPKDSIRYVCVSFDVPVRVFVGLVCLNLPPGNNRRPGRDSKPYVSVYESTKGLAFFGWRSIISPWSLD